MSRKQSPSIFATLQKTAEHASAANGELVRSLPVDALEDNPMNRFSMAEDAQFQSTLTSLEQDGFLDDVIVTPCGDGRWRIVSGHRRVAAARKLGKATVPCKVRTYPDSLAELRALMGANVHRRSVTPFDLSRQLQVVRDELAKAGQLPEGAKEQAERLAQECRLSRASVERYLDLWNLSPTLTAWAEAGQMSMTDAYELSRKKNRHLQPLVEDDVNRAPEADRADFPALVHRALERAKAAEQASPDAPPDAAPSPAPDTARDAVHTVERFSRSLRRSTAQLRALKPSTPAERETVRRKLDTCLAHLEELRQTVETLRQTLDGD